MAKSAKKKLAKPTPKAQVVNKKVTKTKPQVKAKAQGKPADKKTVQKKSALKVEKKATKPVKEPKQSKTATAGKKTATKAAVPEKRVALGPLVPGRLGEKRNCLKCKTKFYDFERTPITCPKCFSEFDAEDFAQKIILKSSDSKKARQAEKEEEPERELVVSDSGEDFESLEDLSDDDSAVVGIGPDKDSDESFD
jgi:hypothetical protein